MALEGAGLPRGTRAAGWRDVRFDQDLHADSLDLVEVVEGVERDLRRRGLAVSVADADLADLETVGDAVDAFVARTSGGRPV
jgi:acyl carrier protein